MKPLRQSSVQASYKQTDVGVIPEEWEVKRLGEMARIQRGASPRPIESPIWFDESSSIGWVRISDVTRSGMFLSETTQRLSKLGVQHSRPVAKGSLIMSICATVGRPIITEIDVCIHDGFVVFDSIQAERLFLYYVLKWIEPDWSKHGQTGSQMNLNTGLITGTRIPLPPEATEQRAIATALSDVDALLGALDRLIAKKRDLKQAAMQQLLTPPGAGQASQPRLPGFHGEWEVKRFGELASPRRDRVDPRRAGVQNFCIELEHIASASGELLGSTSTGDQSSLKSVFHPGDVLFGKLRAYLRKYWLATRSGVCSTEVWVLTPKDRLVTTEFLFQLIKTDEFIEAASNSYGTHMPRSDWSIVKQYELKLPPLPEQTAIAGVLTDMDAELAALEQQREKTRALKQGMMQELLTGRTRLV